MKININIGNSRYLMDVDNHSAEILLMEYSDWFSKFDKEEYKVLIRFERGSNVSKNLLNFFGLQKPETIGKNKEKKDLIVKENDCVYMNTHLFHNETVYMSLDLSAFHIHIIYFSDLSIADLMALIKTAFIWANNYFLDEYMFLMHASAVELEKNKSTIFIGASGAGKTTVAKYCYENGYLVLSDETILLWQENGNCYVQGTPWHGSEKSIIGSAKICRLNEIYILNKHKEDFYKKSISNYENKCVLLNQWLNCAQFNIDKFIQGTKFIADLINNIDIYKLFFTKSDRFIGIIKAQEALS